MSVSWEKQEDFKDPDRFDPQLLAAHTTFQTISVPDGPTFNRVRVYFRPFALARSGGADEPLPLVVFCHGLGGSIAQMEPLIREIGFLASYLAVDLPGSGRSALEPADWESYSFSHLVGCLAAAILAHVDKDHEIAGAKQKVILIGHSMGASHCAHLASELTTVPGLIDRIAAVIPMCPPKPLSGLTSTVGRFALTRLPRPVFNLLRALDQRGDKNSPSVVRFTGPAADDETKQLQLRAVLQSQTETVRRHAAGLLASSSQSKVPAGLAGTATWGAIRCPVLMILGGDDNIIPVADSTELFHALPGSDSQPGETADGDWVSQMVQQHTDVQWQRHPGGNRAAAMAVIPAAVHSVPFATKERLTVARLIRHFVAEIDPRLSTKWQVSHLNELYAFLPIDRFPTEMVDRCTSSLVGGLFFLLCFPAIHMSDTIDDRHSPVHVGSVVLSERFSAARTVIDVGHLPHYGPAELADRNVQCVNFPTEPGPGLTFGELVRFCNVVDRVKDNGSPIVVHAEHGSSRPGVLAAAYLVIRTGVASVQEAVDQVAAAGFKIEPTEADELVGLIPSDWAK